MAVAAPAPASALAPAGYRVVAIGDSVTAGFGYCGTADSEYGAQQDQQFSLTSLFGCASGPLDDRCSSNYNNPLGTNSSVSWALQFARREGITDFRNSAIQGSTPEDWAGGQLDGVLGLVRNLNQDLILMTLGANPILSQFARGIGLPCLALGSVEDVRSCASALLAYYHQQQHLETLYGRLLSLAPRAHIVTFLYHTPIPYPAAQIANRPKVVELLQVVNENVHRAVQSTQARYPGRITVLTPDHSPWPLQHQCSSVQALMGAEWFFTFGTRARPGHRTSRAPSSRRRASRL